MDTNFPYISLGLLRRFFNILPVVVLSRFFLNINPMKKLPKKLLEQVKDRIRLKHYSYRTEESNLQWIKRYVIFHQKCHPCEMGKAEVEL